MRSIPSRECLCSEFSLAQQKRTKEGLGPVLAGQRGSAHRTDMKISGFIRQTQRNTAGKRRPETPKKPSRSRCHADARHRGFSAIRRDAGRKVGAYKASVLSSERIKFRVSSH